MKPQFLVVLALPLLAVSVASNANNIPDGSPVAPAGSPKSYFVSDPFEAGFGKDPFFPRTDRFKPKAVEIPDDAVIKGNFPEVSLKGISAVEGRKLAIINNYTLSEGEEFSLKKPDGKAVKVKCVTIKDKSVLVSSQGETKEISLRAAVQ